MTLDTWEQRLWKLEKECFVAVGLVEELTNRVAALEECASVDTTKDVSRSKPKKGFRRQPDPDLELPF